MEILIVEDDQVSMNLLKAQLESEGHTVHESADGAQAFRMLEKHRSSEMIISDIHLPNIDGYTLLSMIRNSEKYKSMHFILYTSYYTHKSNETLAYELGADQYVRKSGHAKEILNAVHASGV